jgi:hypothetical protein
VVPAWSSAHRFSCSAAILAAVRQKLHLSNLFKNPEPALADLDEWIRSYNEERPHQGRWCFGKTPMQTFLDAIPLAKEKMIAA